MHRFETKEENANGKPMATGIFIDATYQNQDTLDSNGLNDRQTEIIKAIKELNKDGSFPAPYIVMDLTTLDQIGLRVDGEDYKNTPGEHPISTEAAKNPALKIILSAVHVTDLTTISNTMGGNSIVKCNPAVPVYRWFQCANLMLKYCDQIGRIIPFPITQPADDDQEEMVTFHMLRVEPREFIEYQKVLDHCVSVDGIERGFEIAARYSYEALRERGISKLTSDEVDSTLTHVILMKDAALHGILLHNIGRDDLEDDVLRESHFIFY